MLLPTLRGGQPENSTTNRDPISLQKTPVFIAGALGAWKANKESSCWEQQKKRDSRSSSPATSYMFEVTYHYIRQNGAPSQRNDVREQAFFSWKEKGKERTRRKRRKKTSEIEREGKTERKKERELYHPFNQGAGL